ncbi:MAG TPA: potassium-transporting ATPase subunit C [Thermoplasmata archaeon]|nr:potassium-transporting ATPase subunit C [Thermoplasmata archaeon]
MSGRTGPHRGAPPREPRELSGELSSSVEPVGTGLANDPPLRWPSARSVVAAFLLLTVLTGAAYPVVFSEAAWLLTPESATGGNVTLGQNITSPALFWLRPSLIDYQPFQGAGSEVPYGPVDPALLNETRAYAAKYGLSNVTVPLNLVSPSASGLDPDVTPESALIQIPRVAHFTNLTEAALLRLVSGSIVEPTGGFIGPEYVNVLALDEALLALEHGTLAASYAGTPG